MICETVHADVPWRQDVVVELAFELDQPWPVHLEPVLSLWASDASGKPVALANVRAFYKFFEGRIPIIGTGGVVNGVDAFEHFLCGASAVQIGTVLVEDGLEVFGRLEAELAAHLKKRGYASVAECRGKVKEL